MKKLFRLAAITVTSLIVISCQSQTPSPQSQPSQTASIQAEVDNPDWERFYNLSEKERVKEIKGNLSKDLEYGSWDEDQVINFISFICADEPSSFDPYGTVVSFIDTTKLSEYKSALISYYCIPPVERSICTSSSRRPGSSNFFSCCF